MLACFRGLSKRTNKGQWEPSSRKIPRKKKAMYSLFNIISFYFKVVLLVTDGKQSTSPREKGPIEESKNLQTRGIDVHAMGVGQADPTDLLTYASDPSFILYVDDFNKLDSEVSKQANNLCPRKFQNLVRKIIKIRLDLKPIFMCHFCCSWGRSSSNSSICKSRCSSSRMVAAVLEEVAVVVYMFV